MINVNPYYRQFKIFFDEGRHKYTDNFGSEYLSVTTFIHEYKSAFNKEYWLKKKSEETGMSQKAIEKQWNNIRDEACNRGTRTHNDIEDGIKSKSLFYKAVQYNKNNDGSMITVADLDCINDYVEPLNIEEFKEKTCNKYKEIYNVFDYYVNKGYKIYSEIVAFIPELLICGTIDILILKDDKFVVGDWKTNRNGLQFKAGYYQKDKTTKPPQETDVFIETYKTMLPPIENLPECNGSMYGLQVSLYTYMVNLILGIPNAGIWLCHLENDFVKNQYGMPMRFNDGYHLKDETNIENVSFHKMTYLYNEIIEILKDRKKVIDANLDKDNTI